MKIKILCHCQTKFEFEIEPVNGQMPCPVQCPTCGTDATEAANIAIRRSLEPEPKSKTPLRVASSSAERLAAATPPAAVSPDTGSPAETAVAYCAKHADELVVDRCRVCGKPICRKCMELFGFVCSVYCRNLARERGLGIPVYAQQADVIAAKKQRKVKAMAASAGLIFAGILAVWIWYSFVGSKPKVVFSRKLPKAESSAFCKLVPPNQVLVVTPNALTLYSIDTGQALWATPWTGNATPAPGARRQLGAGDRDAEETQQAAQLTDEDVWIVLSDRVARFGLRDGKRKEDVPFPPPLHQAVTRPSGILIVSGDVPGRRTLTRIELPAGKAQAEAVALTALPRTAGAGLTGLGPAMAEDEFLLTGRNVAQFTARLLEARTEARVAMKPKGNSAFESGNISGVNRAQVQNELINDMRRDATGGIEQENVSRYQVKLTRRLPDSGAEWSSEVVGPPRLFPQKTVDVLVAGRTVYVFDKENRKLWESKLTYPIATEFDRDDENPAAPCLESGNSLYFFDRGMLTAFDLRTGNDRWRLTSVGISSVAADPRGRLYVVSTTASPDSIQYSQQIDLNKKIKPTLLKVDSASGKVLWQVEDISDECFLSGKFVYATRAQISGAQLIGASGDESAVPTHHRVRRLDPDTGRELWIYYRPEAQLALEAHHNYILLQYRNEVRVLKFLTL